MVYRKTLDFEILLCVFSFQSIVLDLQFYSVSFPFVLLWLDIAILLYILPVFDAHIFVWWKPLGHWDIVLCPSPVRTAAC